MADAIVDVCLSWECNTLLDFFFLLINFISLLNNHIVTDFTKFKGRDTKNTSLNQVFQDTKYLGSYHVASHVIIKPSVGYGIILPISDVTSHLVFCNDQIIGNGEFFVIRFWVRHFPSFWSKFIKNYISRYYFSLDGSGIISWMFVWIWQFWSRCIFS